MPELLNSVPVAHLRYLLRAHPPLVHCMTNDMVQTLTANVLLVIGASPAMVIDPRETAQFVVIVDALLINVDTLTEDRAVAMCVTVKHVRQAGRFWTLDPVTVGALTMRTAFCHELLILQSVAIRGNVFEILALVGMSAGGCEVDTTDTAAAALLTAQALARRLATVVAVTGKMDYVIGGERILSVVGSNLLVIRVVDTGRVLSAVVAANAVLSGSRPENVIVACGLMKQAGEIAVRQGGPSSFILAFLGILYQEVQG